MATPTRLFNRNFFLLWQGQLISRIGSEAHYIALAFWVKHATGSASLMGAFMMAATIPRVILGPFAGAFIDRHSRRGIIIIGDIICGISTVSLAGCLFLVPEQTGFLMVWMFIVTVVVASTGSFFAPAMSAAIPDIVPTEKLASANSANQASTQLSGFIGLGAGGVAYRLLGAPVMFLFDGLSYLVAAFFSTFTSIPQELSERKTSKREVWSQVKLDVKDGLRYVWRQTGLRALFIFASAMNFFFTPVAILMPFFVEDSLKSTPDWMGYTMAAFGVGALLGYLVAAAWKTSGQTRSRAMVLAIIVMSVLIGAIGLVQSPWQAVALMFLGGIFNGYINVNLSTILQITTPSEIRGRVFGMLSTLSSGLTPIAMGLSGVVADLVHQNIAAIFIGCGVLATATALAVSFSRDFRAYVGYEKPVAPPATAEATSAAQQ